MSLPRPMTALIADDESHVRLFLKSTLKTIGFDVVAEAGDGAQAIERYRTHRPDLMLLDVNMPSVTGREALAAIIREFPDAFIIMVTSLASAGEVEASLEAGASHYLRKDTPLADLKQEILDACADRFGPSNGEPTP